MGRTLTTRILLAEDNPRLSTMISEALPSKASCLTTFLRSPRQKSIAVARYDLLLVDLGMLDRDGVAFIRAVTKVDKVQRAESVRVVSCDSR